MFGVNIRARWQIRCQCKTAPVGIWVSAGQRQGQNFYCLPTSVPTVYLVPLNPVSHVFTLFVFGAVLVVKLTVPEHFHAPPGHRCEQPWPQVSCRVDGIAAVQAHGHADGHDDQADAQGLHAFGCADVPPVSDGQDAQDQSGSCNYLENKGSR